MKIVLCYPATMPGHRTKYGLQPLGVLYLAAVLRRAGFDVLVIDADIDGLAVRETARRILAARPDLVGFSLMTPQLLTALACATVLKQARPELTIVLGGAHIDSTRDDVFAMSTAFDFAIHGEGEGPLVECCTALRDRGRLGPAGYLNLVDCVGAIDNVIVRHPDGRVAVNPARAFVRDLDELPPVDYDQVGVDKYSLPSMPGRRVVSMMLSRGCPFACTFCDAPQVMGKKLRCFSIPRILDDIRRYRDRHQVIDFVFKDSTFTANQRWARQLCEALIAADLGIRFRCNTRVDLIPQPLLALMRRAGCYVINFGVESGDPEVLRRIRKEVELDDVVDAFERCRQLGIRTYATFMVGSPGETDATVQRTIALAKRIRPSLCFFGVATAYPGTPMYDEALAAGEIEPRWWATQAHDPTRHSAFQVRWGWTAAGALRLAGGFDAEYWQRRATREWYLRPRFVWDTAGFTARNPYFLRHLAALGVELLPLARLRNLLPGRPLPVDERAEILAQCPSQPHFPYRPRSGLPLAH